MATVDGLLASFWHTVYQRAVDQEQAGGQMSGLVVVAGLQAAPYLLRVEPPILAASLLERAGQRDRSPGTARRILGYLGQALAGEIDPSDRPSIEGAYAWTLARLDPDAAQAQMRRSIDGARAEGRYATAAVMVGYLVDLLRRRGDLSAALIGLDEVATLNRLAQVGPWTQAVDEGRRLQVLRQMGRTEEVLREATDLLARLDTLPAAADGSETAEPFNVRETTLQIAGSAASDVGNWTAALEFNRRTYESLRQRGAPHYERARCRFNDYGPLLSLSRYDEAELVLVECQDVFEATGDLPMLAKVFSARAELEDERGRPERAAELEYAALRYTYQQPEPAALAVSHNNLANYLTRTVSGPDLIVAHRLAAALLDRATGRSRHLTTVRSVARELARYGDGALPEDVDDLAERVGGVPGVYFGDLFSALVPDRTVQEALLAETIAAARDAHDEADASIVQLVEQWAPVIESVVDAAHGDPQATEQLSPAFDYMAATPYLAAVGGAVRRILAGERDAAALVEGLDPGHTAIVSAILERLREAPTSG
jgi:hypothetical protein